MKASALFPDLTERSNFYRLDAAAEQGLLLPSISAAAFEEALVYNDCDLITRARLLGFYFNRKGLKTDQRKSYVNQIVWFIKNVPASKFCGSECLSPHTSVEAYEQLKKLWSEQMNAHPDVMQIKINAALFSLRREQDYCVKLLKAVIKESPNNMWAIKLLSMLGLRRDVVYEPEVAELSKDQLLKKQQIADKIFLDTVFMHGQDMPPDSALNMEEVLAKFPSDVNARVELMGHYSGFLKRANVLGVDPEYLHSYVRHLLWCVEHIPGSSFMSARPGISALAENLPSSELRQLKRIWQTKIKSRQTQTAIVASQADEKVVTSDQEAIAIDVDASVPNARPETYSYVDWATEVNIASAHLEGFYHWVPRVSIAHLDSVIDKAASKDIYSRAKIIGLFDNFYSWADQSAQTLEEMGLSQDAQLSHVQHMLWFVENMPECQVVVLFNLEGLKRHNQILYMQLEKALIKTADRHKKNLKVQVNVAAAFVRVNEQETRRLVSRISALCVPWAEAVLALIGDKPPEPNVGLSLRQHEFITGQKNSAILKIAKKVDLIEHSTFGWSMTRLSTWSGEYVLSRNPNDVVLRAQLLQAYSHLDRYSINFWGSTPDFVPKLLRHNLWFIQNLPDYYLYATGCRLNRHGFGAGNRYLGPQAVLVRAVKRQMKAYHDVLGVGLSLVKYFPLGYEKEALSALQSYRKHFPGNRSLNTELEYLKGSINRSSQSAKQRASLSHKDKV